MLHKTKAQSSIELVILVGAFVFFFIVFLLVVQEQVSDEQWQNRNFEVSELAVQVQQEIYFATQSIDGYYREFNIPQTIKGSNYEIDIVDSSVYIRTLDGLHALSLPVTNVTGDIQKGDNTIRRLNGIVYLNS